MAAGRAHGSARPCGHGRFFAMDYEQAIAFIEGASGKGDKRGLYNLVIIDKVIVSNLIKSAEYLTAERRYNLSFNIFVFKGVYIVFNIGFFV